ncbi:GNAT family N-acetyltransferase [uncultured Aquitalea sp.]|uniref:GNAT family N-acetyltransferase n=1 Tax=uncultured Aquitalea sp. TaxID=540272 RepID=UPI0025DE324C|nr:GNAT family N-acetyltransferase [uncultured Aquitalea sp.]
MPPIITPRLRLREFTIDDAQLVLDLLNDPDFIRFVADKGVRTLDDAVRYLTEGPLTSYADNGFGLWCVERLDNDEGIGMCGLIRRPDMPWEDVGYNFLPAGRGQGFAREAAAACVQFGLSGLGLQRVVAFIDPGNIASARVLEAAGLRFCGPFDFPGASGPTHLYSTHPEN